MFFFFQLQPTRLTCLSKNSRLRRCTYIVTLKFFKNNQCLVQGALCGNTNSSILIYPRNVKLQEEGLFFIPSQLGRTNKVIRENDSRITNVLMYSHLCEGVRNSFCDTTSSLNIVWGRRIFLSNKLNLLHSERKICWVWFGLVRWVFMAYQPL